MNKSTHEAWPSIRTLEERLHCKQERIRESIAKMKGDLFNVRTDCQKHIYVFPSKMKGFEPFSRGFLDKSDLSNGEKGYLAASQQYMFTDIEGQGKISYQVKDLANLINLPEHKIWKYNRELVDKGYLRIVDTMKRDFETSLPLKEMVFDLSALEQSIIWELSASTKHIRKNNVIAGNKDKDVRILAEALHEANARKNKEYVPLTVKL